MINQEYVRKQQIQELRFIWNHMTHEQQQEWLKSARILAKYRMFGKIYARLWLLIHRILAAFYLY